jgi:hypothetical protein
MQPAIKNEGGRRLILGATTEAITSVNIMHMMREAKNLPEESYHAI